MSPEPTSLDRNPTRPHSPDGGAGNERKRRRKVLSCYDCRRRKLQCDRGLPACARCTKAGQAATCLYLEDAAEAPVRDLDNTPTGLTSAALPQVRPVTGVGSSSAELLSRLEFQDTRIKQLEAALAQANASVPAAQYARTGNSSGIATTGPAGHSCKCGGEAPLLRGGSFKTQYVGNTHPLANIAYMPEIHDFTKQAIEQFPSLARLRDDMRALEHNTEPVARLSSVTDSDLKALLPTKAEADILVQLYFDNYGHLYHVLHLPTFRKDYDDLWLDLENSTAHFVALLLVLISAARCLATVTHQAYIANSSVAREKAVEAIRTVEDWLLSQSQKHVSALDFQIRILLLFTKIPAARKHKRAWTDAGQVRRFCMSAGLHRNPEYIRKPTSVLDKELRKRMWAAVVELDLQASFSRGMVPSPWALQSDCPPPSHILDEDIDADSEHIPNSRPAKELTDISYLVTSNASLSLRTSLNTSLNALGQTITFDETKRYTDELETHLHNIPPWTGTQADIPRAMLSLNLRQYLLALHDRQVRYATTPAERNFSRMYILDTAVQIISTHQQLLDKQIFALELVCHDQVRAALSLCCLGARADPTADDALTRAVLAATADQVPTVITMLEDKVVRHGREQRQLWMVLSANAFLVSKRDPAKKLAHMQAAVDRVTRPYYKILACQDDMPTLTGSSGPPTTTDSDRQPSAYPAAATDQYPRMHPAWPKGPIAALPPTGHPTPPTVNGGGSYPSTANATDPPLFDLDEIAAWTFEDFPFNAMDMGADNFGQDLYS